jgi:hypothetical protein
MTLYSNKTVYKGHAKRIKRLIEERYGRKRDEELFTFLQNMVDEEESDEFRHRRLWQAIHVRRHEKELKLGKHEYDYVRYVEYVAVAWHMGGWVEKKVVTTLFS